MGDLLSLLDDAKQLVILKHQAGRHDQETHTPKKYSRGGDIPGVRHELQQLARMAQQSDTFEEFQSRWFRGQHGQYWHLTSDPNFEIDPKRVPRDASSIAGGGPSDPGLMVTEDVESWDETLNPELGPRTRNYAAEIDLSGMEYGVDYQVTTRGFGNEIFIFTPGKAKVMRVIPLDDAIQANREYFDEVLPQSKPELQNLYDKAHQAVGD
jgi:hypothetical protein